MTSKIKKYTIFNHCSAMVEQKNKNITDPKFNKGETWGLTSHNSYQFSKYELEGSLNNEPSNDSGNGNMDFKGEFNRINIQGNNDPYYKISSFVLDGNINHVTLSENELSGRVKHLNKSQYEFDLESMKIPENRMDGYYSCVDIATLGGWWRIRFPYIRTVKFYGWATDPVDTYREKASYPIDFLDNPNSRLEKIKENKHQNIRSKNTTKNTAGYHNIMQGLIYYQSGSSYPDFEVSKWRFFLMEGTFFSVRFIDKTYQSQVSILGPFNKMRLWNTYHFPWVEDEEFGYDDYVLD